MAADVLVAESSCLELTRNVMVLSLPITVLLKDDITLIGIPGTFNVVNERVASGSVPHSALAGGLVGPGQVNRDTLIVPGCLRA